MIRSTISTFKIFEISKETAMLRSYLPMERF